MVIDNPATTKNQSAPKAEKNVFPRVAEGITGAATVAVAEFGQPLIAKWDAILTVRQSPRRCIWDSTGQPTANLAFSRNITQRLADTQNCIQPKAGPIIGHARNRHPAPPFPRDSPVRRAARYAGGARSPASPEWQDEPRTAWTSSRAIGTSRSTRTLRY